MASTPVPTSVDEYIAGFPPETQRLLQELRAVIEEAVPSAAERISYRMATFDYRGRVLVYMAGFQGHVSLYPIIGAVEAELGQDLLPYKYGKGTVRFALDQALPVALVRRIVQARMGELEARKAGSAR